tara:strand:- start:96 stop:587 length:492 start_codon:yes stop_codon:yes gene_type:complete
MKILSTRQLNLAGFLMCAGMMGYALYAEHVLMLMPCPLCVFQRIAVIALSLIFLVAAIHNSVGYGRYIYALSILLAATAGAVVAGRHVWLQNLPADKVPSCGPGFDYIIDSFPLSEALGLIFSGSGECASIDWEFLSLSMPAWVLIVVIITGIFGIWLNMRRI